MKSPVALSNAVKELGTSTSRLLPVEGLAGRTGWRTSVPGAEALRCWQGLRDRAAETGYWPVLVSGAPGPGLEKAKGLIKNWVEDASETDIEETLAAATPFEHWAERERDPEYQAEKHTREAEKFDSLGASGLADLHRQTAGRWLQFREEELSRGADDSKREVDAYAPPVSSANNRNPPQHELSCIDWYDAGTSGSIVADKVLLLFVPATEGWRTPAYLGYTTREGERPPAVHVAALKWLKDQYGADLAGVDDRILESSRVHGRNREPKPFRPRSGWAPIVGARPRLKTRAQVSKSGRTF